ncbi:hypothetical protein GQ600_17662 [Phytophthora cactorum]|nr:hypothetical protein GQ600_17662 [Phytophthora cactorum]
MEPRRRRTREFVDMTRGAGEMRKREEPCGRKGVNEYVAWLKSRRPWQREKDQEHAEHDDDTEYEDGALSNPLVDELFRTIPDVRHVIKDKPALMVLVKKTMIDEIQEILQSLQMELQFERHSTMAVGSMRVHCGVAARPKH